MSKELPFESKDALFERASSAWTQLESADWLEAFSHHPRIGDISQLRAKFTSTAQWAAQEQRRVADASDDVLRQLALENDKYYRKFGFIFLICATGKVADEILESLRMRLSNTREDELRIAAGEQAKITRLRLEKLLAL